MPSSSLALVILLSVFFCGSSLAAPDSEYQAILHELETGDHALVMKRLEAYHRRGKRNDQSLTLLAHLYAQAKQFDQSLELYLKVTPAGRDAAFWSSVLLCLRQQDIKGKAAPKEPLAALVLGLKETTSQYDKKTVEALTGLLERAKEPELSQVFCQDLAQKNNQKCRL